MNEEEIISALKELIRCYDLMNSPDSPHALEVNMWRKRFIESNNLSPLKARYFYCIPSETLMKTTPEELIKNLGDA